MNSLLTGRNLTAPLQPPEWNSKGMLQLPDWGEPLIVLTILCTSMFLTRRRGFSIFSSRPGYRALPLDMTDADVDSARSSDDLLFYDVDNACSSQESLVSTKNVRKRRKLWFGLHLYTPNTSRFANHLHSRVLQKFPFLVEMFYWIITYLFYRMTKVVSKAVFEQDKLWGVAQENGLRILWLEHESWLAFVFPLDEHDVQHWFMHGHQDGLTFLNRTYALIHIPGTVGFIAWYYYVAPTHDLFAVARRTLTLTNLLAFLTFTFYPTMPPRLLPKEYGFLDTVRHDNAQSIFMRGDAVNSLAAMPSMHFGYAFCIGCTMLYHSGIFRRNLAKGEVKKSPVWKFWYVLLAVGYPALVLSAIVSTANHYWLDAVMAMIVATLAYLGNRVFLILLPLEDYLLWALRLEKPIPSTGERFHQRGGAI